MTTEYALWLNLKSPNKKNNFCYKTINILLQNNIIKKKCVYDNYKCVHL